MIFSPIPFRPDCWSFPTVRKARAGTSCIDGSPGSV